LVLFPSYAVLFALEQIERDGVGVGHLHQAPLVVQLHKPALVA